MSLPTRSLNLGRAVQLAVELLATLAGKTASELNAYLAGGEGTPVAVPCATCDTGPTVVTEDGHRTWVCQACARTLGWDGCTPTVGRQGTRVFGTRRTSAVIGPLTKAEDAAIDAAIRAELIAAMSHQLPASVMALTDEHRGWIWTDSQGDQYRWHNSRWQLRFRRMGDWDNLYVDYNAGDAKFLTEYGPYTRGDVYPEAVAS